MAENVTSKRRNHTTDEVRRAIMVEHGVIAKVAERLDVDRSPLYRRIKASVTLTEALEDARESMKDLAEHKLFGSVLNGDPWAIQFYLKTQGRDRGYAERHEVTGPEGGPITVRTIVAELPPERDE